MSDDAGTGDQGDQGTDGSATDLPGVQDQDQSLVGDAGKKAIDSFKAERNTAKAEAAAARKEADAFKRQLQQLQERDMSELQRAQKAAVDADARAKEVAARYGERLARSHFDALAARRNPDAKTAEVLEYVDLSRFVNEDGDLDEKGLAAAVARLIPEPQGGAPTFDGGARKSPPAGQDMNQIIRTAAGRA